MLEKDPAVHLYQLQCAHALKDLEAHAGQWRSRSRARKKEL